MIDTNTLIKDEDNATNTSNVTSWLYCMHTSLILLEITITQYRL